MIDTWSKKLTLKMTVPAGASRRAALRVAVAAACSLMSSGTDTAELASDAC